MSRAASPEPLPEPSGRSLSTAVRVLETLGLVAEEPRGVSPKTIARRLGVSLSSVYYLLNSLREDGFVEQLAPGLYTLGPMVPQLYDAYLATTMQPERLEPILEDLRDRTRCRTYGAVWRDADLEVIEICGRQGARELRGIYKGFRGAAHALALGKVFLASMPDEQWPAYLQREALNRLTSRTIGSRSRLRHHLRRVHDRRLAFDLEEFEIGKCCAAAPLCDARGAVVASIGLAAPASRFHEEARELVSALRSVAAEASREFSGWRMALRHPGEFAGCLEGSTRMAGSPHRATRTLPAQSPAEQARALLARKGTGDVPTQR